MYCKKCGKEIDIGSNFCNFCGANQNEDVQNSATFNFGKVLGTIGVLAATNKIMDDFNEKERKKTNATAKIGALNMEATDLMIKLNGGVISKEEYDRRCYDIDKQIKEIRESLK